MAATGVEGPDRVQVERIVHEALGRQLKTMSLLGLLLAVVCFFFGHFVAASYSRFSTERLEARLGELQGQIADLAARCSRQEASQAEVMTIVSRIEQHRRDDAERDRAMLSAMIEDADARRDASLRELEAYSARRLHVPAAVVSAALNRFVDDQVLQMDRLLLVAERRVTGETAPSARSNAAVARAPKPPDESPLMELPPTPRITAGPAGTRPAVIARPAAAGQYFQSPPNRGYLYFSPQQPDRLHPARVTESEPIPLPPR